jgi:hypothetical protein
MRIGEEVTYKGRRYAVVGFTPFAVIPFRVELADPETNSSFWIEWPPTDAAERVALRVLTDSGVGPPPSGSGRESPEGWDPPEVSKPQCLVRGLPGENESPV